jgi:ABC-type multidrug transport system ATPase subunit
LINISLDKVGKKFNREWIFRNLDLEITSGDKLLVQGGNGSGKSTLLQVISGFISPNEGELRYTAANIAVDPASIKDQFAFASPYLVLIEDFTAAELIHHISLARRFKNKLNTGEILEVAQLSHTSGKYIRQFSSGMKQRLKLAIAILSDVPVLLLDEPLSNLDRAGGEWYAAMINNYCVDQTIVVCSNAIEQEHFFCRRAISVLDYKS